ncbi:hypothetical protein YDYSY3_39010 [Paenibacillus chitinolyticus]|uniref:DUF4830 domain-containing protein n=1 Tax=Paenibacillus chitinolyticus TaxID=79263 RepID=UPI0026E4E0D0|nr:DUF4830 domain-containing protein [Paenibacillus chitinolyticus]GKS12901.1 hypothetical protein YDYSY3_39010 [Paenibacillus chitinolyticus]
MYEKYLLEKDLTVVKNMGEEKQYILTRDKLTHLPYMALWGVQNKDVTPYINKEITSKSYIVKNKSLASKLDLRKNDKLKATLLIVDQQIVGGYLLITNTDPAEIPAGLGFSLTGGDIEELSKKDFQTWQQDWISKYKD